MDEEKDITQFVMIADLDGFGWSNYDVSCAKVSKTFEVPYISLANVIIIIIFI